MASGCYLFHEDHIPEKAAFPVVDAHNHLWANVDVNRLLEVMDTVGVASYCDLTAGSRVAWVKGGCLMREAPIEEFLEQCAGRHPGRFYGFTTATFARPVDEPLFDDPESFAEETVELLRRHVGWGARGLKIMKSLGLQYRDGAGGLVALDAPALSPIWQAAGTLGVPVLIHASDPYGFFEPDTPENEHHDSLQKYPSWAFADPKFPRKAELLRRRDNLIRRHGETVFILAHVANFAENLQYVAGLLDENPNAYIDFSARIDELGRQPRAAREFFIRYQDRILFGTDMPGSAEIYRCYFRFLETFDEYFIPPDYDGTFGRFRWRIHGLGLPKDVLAKVYYRNALKLIPGLKDDLKTLV